MNNIGKTIKKIREEKNFTQEQLAEKLNVTRQAVSNWETGKTQPDIDTIIKISGIFEVEVEEIIYGQKKNVVVNTITTHSVQSGAKAGIGFGTALAMIISYVKWGSIGWAILHGLFSWGYVIYYMIKY